MKKKNLYTSGEFANLMKINKRTLHYYNDIGLFCPEVKGENGYHYYTIFQAAKLEMILMLRKIGIPIKQIASYMEEPSDERYFSLLENQISVVDKYMEELTKIKNLLTLKKNRLNFGMKAKDKMIKLCFMKERRIILSDNLGKKSDEETFSQAEDFYKMLKNKFSIADKFGVRISLDSIEKGDFENYDSYYAYCPDKNTEADLVLEEGTYIMAFSSGSWEKLPSLYNDILSFAKENNIKLTGYSYEEDLNEFPMSRTDGFISMITIRAEKNK